MKTTKDILKPLNDYIEQSFMIVLPSEQERRALAAANFDEYGLPIEFVNGVIGSELTADILAKFHSSKPERIAGKAGCYIAHMNAIEKAMHYFEEHQDAERDFIAIFESDANVKPEHAQHLQKALDAMPEGTSMLFLNAIQMWRDGYYPISIGAEDDSIVEVSGARSASAIMYHKDMLPVIYDLLKTTLDRMDDVPANDVVNANLAMYLATGKTETPGMQDIIEEVLARHNHTPEIYAVNPVIVSGYYPGIDDEKLAFSSINLEGNDQLKYHRPGLLQRTFSREEVIKLSDLVEDINKIATTHGLPRQMVYDARDLLNYFNIIAKTPDGSYNELLGSLREIRREMLEMIAPPAVTEQSENYHEVKKLVEEGKLRLIHIDSPPRTISTGMLIAMSESPSINGHVNEPSTIKDESVDKVDASCAHILEAAKSNNVEDASPENPVVIITKHISSFLTDEQFKALIELSDGIITIEREPLVTMESVLKREANRIVYGSSSEDKLTAEEFREVQSEAESRFAKLGFRTTGWKSTNSHVGIVEEHMKEHPEKAYIAIADGSLLCLQPEKWMRQVCDMLSSAEHLPAIEYSQDMVDNWHMAMGANFNSPNHIPDVDEKGVFTTAWTRNAITSKGFKLPTQKPIPLDDLSPATQRHLTNQAIPHYLGQMKSDCFLGPNTIEEVLETIYVMVKNKPYRDVNPVSAYALIAALNEKSMTPEDIALKRQNEELLQQDYPEHAKMFHYIDEQTLDRKLPAIDYVVDISLAEQQAKQLGM